MPRFAANLSMLYTEAPFLERFALAASDGFQGVEYLFPYDFEPELIVQRLRNHGLTQVLFNLPPGDWASGERGIACHAGREEEFARSVQTALRYAKATNCRLLHVMAGIVPAGLDASLARQTYIRNLKAAADCVAPDGITLLIEPINGRDMPGYFLQYQQQAHDVVAEVGASNLKVQMDFYHCQIMEGDLTRRLERHFAGVGHVQVAGVPDRHEPDLGEVNFEHVFSRLDALGYAGWIGCEYRPAKGTSTGLGWVRPYLDAQA